MNRKDIYSTKLTEEQQITIQTVLPELFEGENNEIKKFKISIESTEEPEILYHYASINTFEKILTESIEEKYFILRGTNIEYLNDFKELNLAIELMQDAAKEFEAQGKDFAGKKLSEFLTQTRLKSLLNSFGLKSDLFITSFSENSDSLPMWNMYGNNGNGIAIGCRRSNIIREDNEFSRWGRCIYNEDLHRKFFQEYFPEIYNSITINGNKISIGTGILFNETSFYFGTFKHRSFEYEKEWRLMKQLNLDRQQIKFQTSNGILRPFIENKFLKSDLKKIVLGPCIDKELSKRSVQMLLQKVGFSLNKKDENFVEVLISDAPYRII